MNTNETGWLGIAAAATALIVAMTCTAAPAIQQWPKEINTFEGRIMVYEPQVETFGGGAMTARAAVSIQPSTDEAPIFGVAWFQSQVEVNRNAGIVDLVRTRTTQVRFPGEPEEAEKSANMVAAAISRWNVRMSLDAVLASVAETEAERGFQDQLNNEPPTIIFRYHSAMLVVLDGEPKMTKIEGTDIMRVVNTPYILVLDVPGKTYYLKAGNYWMKARDFYGPWSAASKVPSIAVAIAEGDEKSTARGMTSVVNPPESDRVPEIIVATEPTELVVIDGNPEYKTITGTTLLYVSNTDNDLFLDIDTQKMYLLIAGRWFAARRPEGPWSFVEPDRLPTTFANIPPDSAMGHVLANIAGTEQAAEAVADTYIPQTAAVRRSEAKVVVVYDGEPRFEPITGTTMLYAVNTPSYVILNNGWYYCCDNAVWFVARSPVGPWIVCDTVPQIIYTIPPSSPMYHVRYVRVYYSTPEVVWFGYLPGYTGCYIRRGCVVYGTGYRYRGWYNTCYYPRPVTWGFAFRYSYYSGWDFGVCFDWSGCFGATRTTYVYGGWWGCGGFRVHDRYHPRRDRIIIVDRRGGDRFDGHDRFGRPGRFDDRPEHRDNYRRTASVYDRRNDVAVRSRDTRGPEPRDRAVAVDGRMMKDLAPARPENVRYRDSERRDTDRGDSGDRRIRTGEESPRIREAAPSTRFDTEGRSRQDRISSPTTDSRRLPDVIQTQPSANEQNTRHGSSANRNSERADRIATVRTETPRPEVRTKETDAPRQQTSQPVPQADRQETVRSRIMTPAVRQSRPSNEAIPQQKTNVISSPETSVSSARRESIQSRIRTESPVGQPQVAQVVQPRQDTGSVVQSRASAPSARGDSIKSRSAASPEQASTPETQVQPQRPTGARGEPRGGSRR